MALGAAPLVGAVAPDLVDVLAAVVIGAVAVVLVLGATALVGAVAADLVGAPVAVVVGAIAVVLDLQPRSMWN